MRHGALALRALVSSLLAPYHTLFFRSDQDIGSQEIALFDNACLWMRTH